MKVLEKTRLPQAEIMEQRDLTEDEAAETLPTETRTAILKSQDAFQQLLDRYELFSKLMDVAKVLAIRETGYQDWIVQASANTGNDMDDIVMPWSPGLEKMMRKVPWLQLAMEPPMKERYGSDAPYPYAYIVRGDVRINLPEMSPVVYCGLQAGRACDKFFMSGAAGRGDPKVQEEHVKAAAISAFIRSALSRVLGVRNMTRGDIAAIMGDEFARKIKTVDRRMGKGQAAGGTRGPLAGHDTTETFGKLCQEAKELANMFGVLLPDQKEDWHFLLRRVTRDPKGKFPDRASFHDLTPSAANYMRSRIEQINSQQAAQMVNEEKADAQQHDDHGASRDRTTQ